MNTAQHWENVYNTKVENEVSWFQQYPVISMRFVEMLNLPPDANIIDIGGGDSTGLHVYKPVILIDAYITGSFLKGFAESYSTYDIIAGKWMGWGFVYAFIELVWMLPIFYNLTRWLQIQLLF